MEIRHNVSGRLIYLSFLVVFLLDNRNLTFSEYVVSCKYNKDTALDLDSLLNSCAWQERVQLLQYLRELSKLKGGCSGPLKRLKLLKQLEEDFVAVFFVIGHILKSYKASMQ